jgi:septal ring factor EnvC (AmiA/AmiB activator)
MQLTPSLRAVSAVLLAVVLVMIATFSFYYVRSSGTISSLDRTITLQSSELNIQSLRLAADNNTIASLISTVASLRSQAKNIQSEIESDEANITTLESKLTRAETDMASLNANFSSLKGVVSNMDVQISAFDSRIAAYQAQIASLHIQVSTLQATSGAINTALAETCVTTESCTREYSNYNITVAKGSEKNFTFTAASDGGVLLVAVLSSTSPNTMVFAPGEYGPSAGSPVNVGSSGIAAFTPEGYDTYAVYIYDQNMSAFSATVNIWYFH